ncbi:unsaturated rhamnogalacturonyl hydrolase [Epilithonimonas hungarica]|uniref:glycoside hydrolase family 88/105 protein n=1 Tax=Epilithonimonas hungarica TaxID=454006 RepID=UPI00277D42A0|nr:glycoside hydrolase family 88 protein [Epilithonimonas hungarica]MDP9955260.1 unsaturated rhamnogalacturonyl hydrolase [Epilithonimonas hungarica]
MKSFKIFTLLAIALRVIFSCAQKPLQTSSQSTEKINIENISTKLLWSERMMRSEMKRFPQAWQLDFFKTPKWSYPNGLVLKCAELLFKKTGKKEYYDYIKGYTDELVNEDGTIKTYDIKKYNLDMLNSGNVLLYLYSVDKQEKYLKAIQLLRSQIDNQPRTSEGGFWHKKIYPNQMWLDGLYMAEPFYANYTKLFSTGAEAAKAYDDIANQFDVIQKHMVDSRTGLLYHGWDESKEQQWADKQTGLSPNFWGRAMGWYGMAIVDVLDYLPENHSGRERLIGYLKSYSEALLKVQDTKTGLWYQVLDKGGQKGNYLEASASSMFVYTFAKAARKGYLPDSYKAIAKKGYDGIIKNLITVEKDGTVNLNQNCAVAGLGGTPYRSGTYDYYVNEEIRSNDPKGTGPFILASLELEK